MKTEIKFILIEILVFGEICKTLIFPSTWYEKPRSTSLTDETLPARHVENKKGREMRERGV